MKTLTIPTLRTDYYLAAVEPKLLQLEPVNCLMIEGEGPARSSLFMESIETLFGVAFPLKFQQKALGNHFDLPQLEALWWVKEGIEMQHAKEGDWHWKLLFPMPNSVSEPMLEQTLNRIEEKDRLRQLHRLQWATLNEGTVVQALHLGSYQKERGTIARMELFMELQKLDLNGEHHEIYLNDPRITNEDQLRTIIRYPVKPRN